ncbi:MAG: UDP-N-acetylmuramate dehydrogenase, partial [Proteobacteria bacterium]|nr:UDP-N-acetylmuramate dehydrogenase [Candidatus Avisuccinivibrio stercorigallinarum]
MFSLLPYNTFGLDVKAASGLMVNCADDLKLRDRHAPQLILGRGSDVLFTDDFDGQALIAHVRGIEIKEDDGCYLVRAGAGEILDEFIAVLLKQGIT